MERRVFEQSGAPFPAREHIILVPGLTQRHFFIFEILKIKIKQEVELFKMFSIDKRKSEQWNRYMVLTSIVIGQISTNQISQYMVKNWRGFRMLYTDWDGQHGFRFTAKRILRRPFLGFWESEEACWQKVGITPLADTQSSANTRSKLLLWVFIDIQALWNVRELELEVTVTVCDPLFNCGFAKIICSRH